LLEEEDKNSEYEINLCNYDSDWSEIEDLIEELTDDDPDD
jgi:hypothetical protein